MSSTYQTLQHLLYSVQGVGVLFCASICKVASRQALSPVHLWQLTLTAHEKNYHSTKLEFLVLKWAITEHCKEYLLYQPFSVRTDNNPLMYIMTTPNLDATGHQWVGALVKFNFWLEYHKG